MSTFGSFISGTTQTTKLIVLAGMMQLLDVLSFLLAYNRYGLGDNELLPIPGYLYAHYGLGGILFVKVALASMAIVAMILLLRNTGENLARVGAYTVLAFGLAGFVINMSAFLL
jgi:hypothetical protein